MNSATKYVFPGVALVGLIVLLVSALYWVTAILHASLRTDGTHWSKYSAVYPAPKNPPPSTVFWCDPAYATPWAGCNLK